MPNIGGVDVPNWCVAGAAVLTPAAVYAYLELTGRQRRKFFADTPQPEETSAIFAGLANMAETNHPLKSVPTIQQHFKTLGRSWGIRLPKWLFPKNEMFFMTADPAIVAEILSKKDVFHSRTSGFGFDNTLPNGILALRSEGPHSQWAMHRRLIAPLFSDKFLLGHAQSLSKAEAEKELEFLWASDLLLNETQRRNAEPWILQYFPVRFMRWRKAKGIMGKRINDVLSSKQENSKMNMLKALQDAHEDGKKMSKAELTDEILTLLVAGHETTGYTTSWALAEVARHPEVQEKILAETSAVDLDSLPLTTVQSVLPYTWMVWQEALRFHPTVPFIPRQAEVDTTLGGKYKITAGSIVSVHQMTLAHSEEVWGPDVMSFIPERMEKGYPEMHLPFGYGGRTCIGKRLAYVEGVYLLAVIVKNFQLRVEKGSPAPTPRVTITQHAENGIPLLMSRR
eukprot:Skav206749  [mRNA]  locus=scaffold1022:154672:156748:+ [translate_table: standard]